MPWNLPWKRKSAPRKLHLQLSLEQKQRKQIELVAHELYQNRLSLNRPGDPQDDWETAAKIVQSDWHTMLFASHRPLIQLEKKVWEPLLEWADNQALLSLLGVFGNIGLIIAVATYVGSEKQRRDAEVLNAWQTLTNAHGQAGNGGRRRALEFLNASPGANWRRRFPWFCAPIPLCTWPSENLVGIDLSVGSENRVEGEVESLSSEAKNVADIEQEGTSTDESQTSEKPGRVYLVEIQLPKAYLPYANLQDAFLRGANFQDAFLRFTKFQDADLRFTKFQGADLSYANLQGADLGYANFKDTDLTQVNLQSAKLKSTKLRGSNLWEVNLQNAFLPKAKLQDTDLSRANLQGANLFNANLQSADLSYANLQGANLWEANLQGADLWKANLQGAIFLATDLRSTRQISQEALGGDNPPLICNSPLPPGLEIEVDKDRDCNDQMARALLKRHPDLYDDLEDTEAFVEQVQQITWD